MAKPKILIVDDEKPTRDAMARILAPGCDCLTAPDAELAMKLVEENPDLALLLTDYKMPGENGVSLIKRAKAENPSLACILVTAFGEIELAVEAMKEGADDFLTKPITDLAQMEQRVNKALEKHALSRKVAELQQKVDEQSGIEAFTGKSPAMEKVYRLIRQAAKANANVLVEGPSGTGKELVARAIQSLSPRKDRPFVVLNCAALPEALVESELFGHERGAFTDARERRIGRAEAADGGTLFLDEIGDLSVPVQVKLLRFLQERTFSRVGSNEERRSDVRFIAATSRNLEEMMAQGRFREDLYYRLAIFPIALPDLARRGGDVVLLARHFLEKACLKYGKKVDRFSPPALDAMQAYAWPGNVRELENCVERAVLTAQDGCIRTYNLPPAIQGPEFAEDPFRPDAPPRTLDEQLDALERRILEAALRRHGGNRSAAGRDLGVSPRMMNYRLKRLGIGARPADA